MTKKKPAKIERPRFAARVENGRLVAFSIVDQEIIDKLPLGRIFIEVNEEEQEDSVRNKFMAAIGLLFENVDGAGPGGEWPTPNHLRRFILRSIGFAEPIFRVDGIKQEARSMARGAMTFDELVMVTELSRAFCVEKFGFDPFTMWEEEKDAERANAARRR